MTYELGQLAQIIHVTDDLTSSRRLYGEILGGESYYEGYSNFEKRDASIYAIGDLTMEPMSPSDEPGALDMPVGRFLTRFGPRLHSIAINATGVLDLAGHLVESGVRVVGPGGSPVSELSDDGPLSIYTHPKDAHLLIEFVDFGGPLMPSSPRLRPDYDAADRAAAHPAGVLGTSHTTVLVRDLEPAVEFFTTTLGGPLMGDVVSDRRHRCARVRLGTETVVELCQPLDDGTDEGVALDSDGEGLYSLTLTSVDLDRAQAHLRANGIPSIRATSGELVLDRSACRGARLALTSAD